MPLYNDFDSFLASGIATYFRASPKWVFNDSGVLTEVDANKVAIEYDPMSGKKLGALFEGKGKNLAPYSAQFTGVWTAFGASITDDAITALDNVTGMARVTENGSSGLHGIRFTGDLLPGTTYTKSIFVRGSARPAITLYMRETDLRIASFHVDLATGQVVAGHTSLPATCNVKACPSNTYRVDLTFTTSDTPAVDAYIDLRMSNVWPVSSPDGASYVGDGASGVYVWGFQWEVGPRASSYIPTNGAPVVRAADMLDVFIREIWFNRQLGTLLMDYDMTYWTPNHRMLIGAEDEQSLGSVSTSQTTRYKSAVSWNQSTRRLAVNGAVKEYNGAVDLPDSLVTLTIGRTGKEAEFLFGHVRKVAYWQNIFTSQQLETVTQIN